MKYYSKVRHDVIVELIDEAELRIAETKRQVMIYRRNGRLYVRPKAEFLDKFVLIPEN